MGSMAAQKYLKRIIPTLGEENVYNEIKALYTKMDKVHRDDNLPDKAATALGKVLKDVNKHLINFTHIVSDSRKALRYIVEK